MSALIPGWLRRAGTASFVNQSAAERCCRILLGAVMLAAGWRGIAGGLGSIALAVFGWIPLVTGLLGWCPFYAVLGASTRRSGSPKGR